MVAEFLRANADLVQSRYGRGARRSAVACEQDVDREVKGETRSNGPRHLNLTLRQPFGVVGKINPFNHPFRFCAEKSCSSTSRVFVHQSIHQEVVRHLVAEAEKLRVGFRWLDEYEVGPIVSQEQYDRVMSYIASGQEECFEELLSYTQIKNVNMRW